MLVRSFTGADGIPQHGTQHGFERGQIATRSSFQKALGMRHRTLLYELVDQFPVGSVPTDQQHSFGDARGFGHVLLVQELEANGWQNEERQPSGQRISGVTGAWSRIPQETAPAKWQYLEVLEDQR